MCSCLQVAKAKVLCVGAGGIGCELLKTLALSGFRDIQVVSLPKNCKTNASSEHTTLSLCNQCDQW